MSYASTQWGPKSCQRCILGTWVSETACMYGSKNVFRLNLWTSDAINMCPMFCRRILGYVNISEVEKNIAWECRYLGLRMRVK